MMPETLTLFVSPLFVFIQHNHQTMPNTQHVHPDLSPHLNTIHVGDATNLAFTPPDASIHLIITSPPYNAGKKYEQPLDAQDYLHLLSKFIQESYRILANGGRICINVATTEHSPNRFYTGADIHLTYAQKTIHSLTTMPQYSQSQI